MADITDKEKIEIFDKLIKSLFNELVSVYIKPELKIKPESKSCVGCIHIDETMFGTPCDECTRQKSQREDHYEEKELETDTPKSKTNKECFTCYHKLEKPYIHPCCNCSVISQGESNNWVVAKEEKPDYTKHKGYGYCADCLHCELSLDEYPCNRCKYFNNNGPDDNWQPKE